MELQREPIEAALGVRIREIVSLGCDRWTLALAGGDRVIVQRYASADALTTAEVALDRLRGEIDLPVPQIRRLKVVDATSEDHWALFTGVSGDPLAQKLPQIADEALYQIGVRLGQAVYRVHRVAGGRYGALTGNDPCAADEERQYILARLEHDLAEAIALNAMSTEEAADVRRTLQAFIPPGRQAALLNSGLSPETLLVTQRDGRWTLSGILGWEHALSWCPAWEHVTFLEACEGQRCFGLRVGYGNGYDNETQRAYEQVREPALRPYRALLALRRAVERARRGAHDDARRYVNVLLRLVT
ncbi:MAG: phosphotransferase [Roseiflexus sp.]|nr:phosphotransferase [Roseiflexus sp.]MCS7290591.1 phosphotransferase [Roseiflexus sp.]MDW8148181.1 phosphotransferase [Roseiflexaceae bacterium]MDW8231896.1 phosphotransferase [Roseiflexaceae bacterium]